MSLFFEKKNPNIDVCFCQWFVLFGYNKQKVLLKTRVMRLLTMICF